MRKPRVKRTGPVTCHHVMNRTAQQAFWIDEPWAKEIFIENMTFYSSVYYVDILGYAVLSNHYHICLAIKRPKMDEEDLRRRYELLQTRLSRKDKSKEYNRAELDYERFTDLSSLMRDINRETAKAINKIRGTQGHFWSGRYKNLVVENRQALVNVLAYIEMNPVRAGLVEDPADFPYSSLGKIQSKLARGEKVELPTFHAIEKIPPAARATAYVAMMRFIATMERESDVWRQGIPMEYNQDGWQVDLKSIHDALESRAPQDWGACIYGSDEYVEKTMIDLGWLIPLTESQKRRRKKKAA